MNNGLREDGNSLVEGRWKALRHWLRENQPVAIAVSGGIDSITLATAARESATGEMFHAISPAVPPEATTRVRELARDQGWKLKIFDAGEFENADYRANPVNRCFHCKTSLYRSIRQQTKLLIISGTNLDDLGEYRPGLTAAKTFGVCHPYVEVGINKSEVRALARYLGLGSMAELPAAPCLASRVESGIRIEPQILRTIHAAEKVVTELIGIQIVRCRLRAHAIVIELDRTALNEIAAETTAEICINIAGLFDQIGIRLPVSFAAYRAGSAFLVNQHD
jgi:pyridinium-3,5-biscarboxylic acid mononucleotide sulfurtransferase